MATMVRISAEVRDHIVNTLINKKYAKENLELSELEQKKEKLHQEMVEMAYEAAFSDKARKLLDAAPDGFYPEQDHVQIRIEYSADNYNDVTAHFDGDKRIPYQNSWHSGRSFAAVLDKDHPYVKKTEENAAINREFNKLYVEIQNQKHADRVRILTIVNSVTTIKRLLEIWPQVAEYLPEKVTGEGGGVPVQMIEDLNKSFGL